MRDRYGAYGAWKSTYGLELLYGSTGWSEREEDIRTEVRSSLLCFVSLLWWRVGGIDVVLKWMALIFRGKLVGGSSVVSSFARV